MILSMTGFGRAETQVDGIGFVAEVRTVNHRHLDLVVRLPRMASFVESPLRKRVAPLFSRGKVEVSVSLDGSGTTASLELDEDLARRYLAFESALREEHGLPGRLEVGDLLQMPGVARMVEHALPEEALERGLIDAAEAAARAAAAMRETEGETLEVELRGRLDRVAELAGAFEARTGEVVEAGRERLRKRTEQIRQESGLLDEARLHQEIVILADRLDVTEELVRLRSHIEQFRGVLDGAEAGAPVGRRLDFLLQELLRETNTVGSKSADADVAHLVVDQKTELERIREQVQNVE